MIRGTTPTLDFSLPFGTEQLAEAYVTIVQNGIVVIDKSLQQCILEDNVITIKLTQEETLQLQCQYIAEAQIRAKTIYGEVIASNVMRIPVERILKDGVI